jgi:hypothetical protein
VPEITYLGGAGAAPEYSSSLTAAEARPKSALGWEASTAAMQAAEAAGRRELATLKPPSRPGNMTRGATADLRDLIAKLNDVHAEAARRGNAEVTRKAATELAEAKWTLEMVEGSLSGASDAGILLAKQPTASQLSRKGRRSVLLRRAAKAMEESRYIYPDPETVLGALGALLGLDRERDVMELEHRILHALAEGNLRRDGMAASCFLVRLVRAGKLAVTGAADPDGKADLMRRTLGGVLSRARVQSGLAEAA